MNRWGDQVRVAWQEHELLWVRAALTLPKEARGNAFHQIADMRGCAYATVQSKGTAIRKQIIVEAEAEYLRANPVKTFTRARTARVVALPPSQLNTSPQMQAKRIGARA